MERKTVRNMQKTINIVISGPESTGKTDLALHLTKVFSGKYIPEFAREYISNLNRRYTYDDVIHIAREQIRQQKIAAESNTGFIFMDTWLIITKIWLNEVFGAYPDWIDEELTNVKIDLFLLCVPDIPWEYDPVRENGGEKRNFLFNEYKKEIIRWNYPYRLVKGLGEVRTNMAEFHIKQLFHTNNSQYNCCFK